MWHVYEIVEPHETNLSSTWRFLWNKVVGLRFDPIFNNSKHQSSSIRSGHRVFAIFVRWPKVGYRVNRHHQFEWKARLKVPSLVDFNKGILIFGWLESPLIINPSKSFINVNLWQLPGVFDFQIGRDSFRSSDSVWLCTNGLFWLFWAAWQGLMVNTYSIDFVGEWFLDSVLYYRL